MFFSSAHKNVTFVRRFIAAALFLCVGMLTFERVAGDVCDDSIPHASATIADGESASDANLGASEKAQTTRSSDTQKQNVAHPEMHSCHCLHGHFGDLPTRHAIIQTYGVNRVAFEDPFDLPPSIALEPPHRPPLV